MLAQIDAVWWGRERGYLTDAEVLDSPDLVDLDELADAGQLRFKYRHQAESLVGRAARKAERRTLPGRSPRTAGIWLARTRPQAVAWLNQLASDEHSSIEKLAAAASYNPKVVRQGLRLAFLAPEIVAAALVGETPIKLKQIPKLLPLSWREQRRSID